VIAPALNCGKSLSFDYTQDRFGAGQAGFMRPMSQSLSAFPFWADGSSVPSSLKLRRTSLRSGSPLHRKNCGASRILRQAQDKLVKAGGEKLSGFSFACALNNVRNM